MDVRIMLFDEIRVVCKRYIKLVRYMKKYYTCKKKEGFVLTPLGLMAQG